jgi:hypothetical protein
MPEKAKNVEKRSSHMIKDANIFLVATLRAAIFISVTDRKIDEGNSDVPLNRRVCLRSLSICSQVAFNDSPMKKIADDLIEHYFFIGRYFRFSRKFNSGAIPFESNGLIPCWFMVGFWQILKKGDANGNAMISS